MNLPPHFTKTVTSTFTGGAEWLTHLPNLLAECERRWDLTVQPTNFTLSYNYVAPATLADGTEIVLKVGVPNRELRTEIEALRLYAGRGCVRLLDADPEQGVLLLARLHPGEMLTTLTDDDEATRIAALAMQTLWWQLPAEHNFPSVADWGDGLAELREAFGGGTGPFEGRLVDTAVSLFTDLLASSDEPVLLHGDLHHYNILSSSDGWQVIDPKGVVGEPAYEVGALLRNPIATIFDEPDLKGITARRLDILAETLSIDRERMRQWSLAQAVLSVWWSYEDGGDSADWELTMRLANVLLEVS
ncbi:aminoglycoside phosphotransferase family protein [Candidatus Leptofilum sp.]|uniref:aminoglycoside phosphotransferase family protein n=1 Tax=Candidatus Leptofilum sp. TaxID=3241576 RepID=UPI003B5BDAF9